MISTEDFNTADILESAHKVTRYFAHVSVRIINTQQVHNNQTTLQFFILLPVKDKKKKVHVWNAVRTFTLRLRSHCRHQVWFWMKQQTKDVTPEAVEQNQRPTVSVWPHGPNYSLTVWQRETWKYFQFEVWPCPLTLSSLYGCTFRTVAA